MRIFFVVVGLLSMVISFITMVGAKSAIHEILAAVGFLTGWVLLLGSALLLAIQKHADMVRDTQAQVVSALDRVADKVVAAVEKAARTREA